MASETCRRIVLYAGLPVYKCHGGKGVIAMDHLCDGEFNCPMKDDEKMCSETFYCEQNTTVNIPSQYVCDGK